MAEEGIIKFDFSCEDNSVVIPGRLSKKINNARNKLAEMGLIGQYPDGLSYGNISIRDGKSDQFFITASDTGKIKKADKEHYVKILSCDIENNFCKYAGQGLPSSETLTHYIIYKLCDDAEAVIHVHNKQLWHNLKGKTLSTSKSAGYGTVEMVVEIIRLFEKGLLQKDKLMVMEGHEEGVVCFGQSVGEAMEVLEKAIKTLSCH